MLLLDGGEQVGCLLPVLLVEVIERPGIPVGELGLADLCLRVGDDPTRVGIVRVDPRQLGGRGHDGLPSARLMQRGHLIHQCFASLGGARLLQKGRGVRIGRIEGDQTLQRAHHGVPVAVGGGGVCLVRPGGDIALALCLFESGVDTRLTRVAAVQRLKPLRRLGPAFGEKRTACNGRAVVVSA